VRAALGASRWRGCGNLLVESMMLAIGGAVLGLRLCMAGTRALVAYIPGTGAISAARRDRAGWDGARVQQCCWRRPPPLVFGLVRGDADGAARYRGALKDAGRG